MGSGGGRGRMGRRPCVHYPPYWFFFLTIQPVPPRMGEWNRVRSGLQRLRPAWMGTGPVALLPLLRNESPDARCTSNHRRVDVPNPSRGWAEVSTAATTVGCKQLLVYAPRRCRGPDGVSRRSVRQWPIGCGREATAVRVGFDVLPKGGLLGSTTGSPHHHPRRRPGRCSGSGLTAGDAWGWRRTRITRDSVIVSSFCRNPRRPLLLLFAACLVVYVPLGGPAAERGRSTILPPVCRPWYPP